MNEKWKSKKGIGYLVVSLILLVIVIALINVSGGKKPEQAQEPKVEHDKISASVMAEEFVRQKLKSPASAKFPWYDDSMIKDLGDGRYIYKSYVDSQNSFGALVRTNFTCCIKYAGDNKWECESLEFKD